MQLLKPVLKTGLLLFVCSALLTSLSYAQERDNSKPRVSPNASVSTTIGTTTVAVTYGSPSVNDRAIFGSLVPYDKVWRTGANEATTIAFSGDVTVEGQKLEAGTYGLFTIPGEDEWTVVFNSAASQWGGYNYDSSKDVLRLKVAPEEARHMEQLMFYFTDISENSGTLVLHWAGLKVPVSINVQ